MADFLEGLPLQVLPYSNKLDDAIHTSMRYKELESMAAWQDFIVMLKVTKQRLERSLLTPGGTTDQWGHTHEEEKRSVLAFLDTVLEHTGRVHARADLLRETKRKADEQKKRVSTGQIHGDDSIFNREL